MTGSKRILVVDDDQDFRESIQMVLIEEGHETMAAADGMEAVGVYAEARPDLVLLDYRMPGIDGYETFERIIKADPDARVIITSAYAIDENARRAAEDRSLRSLLGKPIPLGALRDAIERHAR